MVEVESLAAELENTMFGFNFGEMLLIAAIALIALGPKQLPEVARVIGKFLNEFKRASSEFQRNLTDANNTTNQAFTNMKKVMDETLKPVVGQINQSLNQQLDLTAQTPAPPAHHAPAKETIALDDAHQMSFNLDESKPGIQMALVDEPSTSGKKVD